MTLQQTPAAVRWNQIMNAAGFKSIKALERAADLSAGTIWTWITPGKGAREPYIRSLRTLKRLLGVSLDELDDILVAWRQELAELAKTEVE